IKRPASHAALHSFPTRRSSDLGARCGELGGEPLEIPRGETAADAARVSPAVGRALGEQQRAERLPAGLRRQAADDREVVAGTRADRKSTRLNSSHVKISYAVFC